MMSTLRVFGGAVYISTCSGKLDFNTHNHGQSILMHLAGLGFQLKARLGATSSATQEIIILGDCCRGGNGTHHGRCIWPGEVGPDPCESPFDEARTTSRSRVNAP